MGVGCWGETGSVKDLQAWCWVEGVLMTVVRLFATVRADFNYLPFPIISPLPPSTISLKSPPNFLHFATLQPYLPSTTAPSVPYR